VVVPLSSRATVRSSSFAVLRLLTEGRVRSGAEIGAALGLSPAMVAEAVREIEALGLEVDEVRRRGLRLRSPFEALDADAIGRALGRRFPDLRLDLLDECDSTNTALAARAAAGAPSGAALACELQRAGRGRRGARWYSGLGTGLTFSLLWRFDRGAAALGGLSLAVGVACIRAFGQLGRDEVALKWPNDLVRGEAKLGGILIELAGEALGPTAAVIGIGVNVRVPEISRRALGRPVADLATGSPVSRNALLAELLAALAAALPVFARHGFAPFRDEWLRHHAYQGRRVRLLVPPRRTVEGVATGVAEDGALVVATGGGVERFHSAQVSLRSAA
jgi:BirA family biotin operon repressor/biotin-[acetyl-CoA-carboxylase] ligase